MISFNKKVDEIKQDKVCGSKAILEKLIDAFIELIKNNPALTSGNFTDIINNLSMSMPQFIAVYNFFSQVKAELNNADTNEKLLHIVHELKNKYFQGSVVNVPFYQQFVTGKILALLVHSNSSTVTEQLIELRKQFRLKVYQTIGRPAKEGLLQAKTLAQHRIEVVLIEDIAFSHVLHDTGLVLLGADCIFPDRFLNKCGTYAIALAAKRKGLPVVVVADSLKLAGEENLPEAIRKELFNQSPKTPEVPESDLPPGIQSVHHDFEWTPNDLVTSFITTDRITE